MTIAAFSSMSAIGSEARCTRRRTSSGRFGPGVVDRGKDAGTLRVVGDRLGRRPGEHEMRVDVRRDVIDEAGDHAERILEPIPAGDLNHDSVIGAERLDLDHLARRSTRPGVPSERVNSGSALVSAATIPALARIASVCSRV